jgi:GTPase SAR1 family protein
MMMMSQAVYTNIKLKEYCEETMPNLPICIALNKSDLEYEEIDLKSLKKLFPNIVFITKTSAKDNSNIEELFGVLSKKIVEQLL